MQTKKCEVCGKAYETTITRKKTCSEECSKELHRRRKKNNKKIKKEEKEKKITNAKLLEDDVKKAKEMGISYGMYKALSM